MGHRVPVGDGTLIAKELGVTGDYLATGKEGVVVDTIPAIKADKKLSLQSKKVLISLVEELYKNK